MITQNVPKEIKKFIDEGQKMHKWHPNYKTKIRYNHYKSTKTR